VNDVDASFNNRTANIGEIPSALLQDPSLAQYASFREAQSHYDVGNFNVNAPTRVGTQYSSGVL
jgi:hypothetical protein